MPQWAYLLIEIGGGALLGAALAEYIDWLQERQVRRKQKAFWARKRAQRRKEKESRGD